MARHKEAGNGHDRHHDENGDNDESLCHITIVDPNCCQAVTTRGVYYV
jgi:hypothetical protein